MSDLVERLRKNTPLIMDSEVRMKAADEVEGLRVEVDGLWNALKAIRNTTGYQIPDRAKWVDHFFPKEYGERPPFDLSDPRYKTELPNAEGKE